jgi:hypothetical protein
LFDADSTSLGEPVRLKEFAVKISRGSFIYENLLKKPNTLYKQKTFINVVVFNL